MIFDTNTLIYLSKNILKIEDIIFPETKPKISLITYIEWLGYDFILPKEQVYRERICASYEVIHLSDQIINETISLRKRNKIKLPDAIIYATALAEGLPLITNNTDDFKKLGDRVQLIDPFTL